GRQAHRRGLGRRADRRGALDAADVRLEPQGSDRRRHRPRRRRIPARSRSRAGRRGRVPAGRRRGGGTRGHPARRGSATAPLRAALALWRGHPYADMPGCFALVLEARRLEELRLRAVETRIEAELTLGRHALLIAELEVLCEEFPVHERFRAQHMLALYHSGRQAEALRAYQKTRAYLAEELGLAPSAHLQERERRIRNQDASSELESGAQGPTLAFLLADIEDSTVLWELHTDAMRTAVAEHDRIVLGAAEAAGGRLVKRVGDGVDLAFADVS